MKLVRAGLALVCIMLSSVAAAAAAAAAEAAPFALQEVRFSGGAEGVMLAGTITRPLHVKKGARLPAVVLIHGTGRADRDETIANHKPFRTLAEALTAAGYAVLRYDKRGVGESGGSIETITMRDLTRDAEAAFDYLRSRPDVDPKRVGLLGHSEGGMIAPLIAVHRAEVAWLVLLGAPTIPGRDIVLYQNAQGVRDRGRSEDEAQQAVESARTLFEIVMRDEPEAQRDIELAAALEAERVARNLPPKFVEDQKRSLLLPHFGALLAYDPLPVLKAVHQPVLMLYGERDHQVPPALNEAPAREALKHNELASVRVLPELNHLFFEAKTGAVSEYASITGGMAPQALSSITDWLQQTDQP
ncbi:MAG: hypothetical protein NVS9B10_07810 [Nevskia sp.]